MKNNAQGAIEYLLIIAAAILVVAIVILAVTGALSGGQDQTGQGVFEQCSSFQELRYNADKDIYNGLKVDLKGYWNLNENAFDSSGNNFHALPCGLQCPTVTQGKWNSKAYHFKRISQQYFDFGDFVPSEEMKTIALWAKLENRDDHQELVSKSANSHGVEVLIYKDGIDPHRRIKYYVMGGTSNSNIKYDPLPDLDRWYFIVATHNGPNSEMNLYIDNVPVTSGSSGNITDGDNNTLKFGMWNSADARYFDGILEEVGIWNRVILPEERDFLWNNGKGREIVFCE
jgi:hypothetical protein